MELNHKLYRIYGAENKSVSINNPKETLILRNGESNGSTLNDVMKIDELETGKIFAWSILEYYKVEEGCLVDNEGNKISMVEGENKIFFKSVEDPFFIEDEKNVTLEYIKYMSIFLGLNTIEETITGLSNEDKQVLVEERMAENEKRQKEIEQEREEASNLEKKKLDEENKRIEAEQKEEELRLAKLEEQRIEAEKEENEKIESESRKKKEEEKRKKEREENENVYNSQQYRALRKEYVENGFSEYFTEDGKYIFFFNEESDKDDKAFVVLKTKEDYEELIGGELTINTDRTAEYEFKDGKDEKVVTLNKKTDTIRVQVLA